jgi:hypothetical protein
VNASARRGAAALAALALLAGFCAAAQAESSGERGRLGEGPLDSDAFLVAHERASASLGAADRAFAELRVPIGDSNRRAWLEALDALHVALRESSTGDMVAPRPSAATPWPDPDGSADARLDRRRDGVEAAVLRRLASLPDEARAAWRERFDEASRVALAAAGSNPARLRDVERLFPGTRPALEAALSLSDGEWERASPLGATTWLDRAGVHARLADLGDSEPALARRRALLEGDSAAPGDSGEWRTANAILPVGALALDSDALRARPGTYDPGLGVRPGLAFLERDRAVVHVPASPFSSARGEADTLVLLDLASASRLATLAPARLLDPLGVSVGWVEPTVEPPGWPLEPASDGRAVVVVLGQRGWEHGNALLCCEFVETAGSAEPPSAQLRWAWHDGRPIAGPALDAGGASDGPGSLEFQPGALVEGDAVFVLGREFDLPREDASSAQPRADTSTEITTWLLSVDLASGAERWRRKLGKGTLVQRSRGRFFAPSLPTSAAQPLSAWRGRVFAGSHTGFGALVDGVDGRIDWALRCRRRAGELRAWTGARAPVDALDGTILWAPADSDQLYWLRGEPDLDGRGLFVRPPRASAGGEILAGGGSREAAILSGSGEERFLTGFDASTGLERRSAAIGPSERFAGDALASDARAWFATTRALLLADRTRGNLLLAAARIEAPSGAGAVRAGSISARGPWVCVVGPRTLWIFRSRP